MNWHAAVVHDPMNSSGTKNSNRAIGKSGEQAALNFFTQRGYTLLDRNYRVPCGEIDLIFEKGQVLVFVEVKARRSSRYGLPQEAVGHTKQQRIIKAAMWYCQERRLQGRELRFDVIALMFHPDGSCDVHHIPNAFDGTDMGLF